MKNAALITGASGGIGEQLAEIHASKQRDLVLTARSEDKLQSIKLRLYEKYGVKILIIPADLTDSNSPEYIYSKIQSEKIEIEYLINNAGFGDYGLFYKSDWQKQQEMLAVNITALTHLTWLISRDMVNKKKGRIMNLASTAAFQPGPLMSVYFATKNYVLNFSEALRNELKEYGISVTTLCPGPTATGFEERAALDNSELFNRLKIPDAEEVARFGYSAMEKGKGIAIHGIINRIMARSAAFVPNTLVMKIVRNFQKGKE